MVSIIIPVFNVEAYIQKCITSVINQTYRDLEIIIIDDGSNDNSGFICDEFKKQDSRIKVIHKENTGLSGARNQGLNICNGEYLFFLDGDDWIDARCIQILIEATENYNAEIAICNFQECGCSETLRQVSDVGIEVLSKEDAQKAILYLTKLRVSAGGRLYKKEIFNNITFPEGKLFEDQVPSFLAISAASTIVLCKAPMYAYVKRPESILTSKYTSRNMDAVYQNEILLDYVCMNYPHLKKGAEARVLWQSLYTMVHIPDFNAFKADYCICNQNIKKYRLRCFVDPNISLRLRITCIISLFGNHILRFLYRIQKRIWNARHNYVAKRNQKA